MVARLVACQDSQAISLRHQKFPSAPAAARLRAAHTCSHPASCPCAIFETAPCDVGDFDHQLGPQRLPRQVLALAPAALATRLWNSRILQIEKKQKRMKKFGWEAGIRTPIGRSRICSPTVGRPPSKFQFSIFVRVYRERSQTRRLSVPGPPEPLIARRINFPSENSYRRRWSEPTQLG